MQIIERDISELIPYINNAKIHPTTQVDQIAASIKEFGFCNPILLDGENGIIAGHGRVDAAKKLKLKTVPTIELSHLSDIQKKAYILADNRLSESGGTEWDFELVSLELEGLKDLLYVKPKGKLLNFIGATTETTVWKIDKDGKNKLHPTQKPVDLPVKAIGNHNAAIVVDFFGGSGSTLIACEKTNRKCNMMEIDEKYCDVIINRWQDFTGKEAVHGETGIKFNAC